MRKSFIATLSALTVAVISPLASAEDYSLHTGVGAAEVFHAPTDHPDYVFSRNKFNTGMEGNAALLFKLVPNLAVGPGVSVDYLPQAAPDTQATVLWQFNGVARLQGDRGNGNWVSPYVQLAGGLAKQGSVLNPGMASAVGVEFTLDPTHTAWGGVFVGWNHTFQVNSHETLFLNSHDGNIGSVGLSLSFDGPVQPKTVTQTVTQTVVEEHFVAVPAPSAPVVPAPAATPAAVPARLELDQRVQFAQNSADLDATAKAVLDQVAVEVKNHPGYAVTAEGHASGEGLPAYNTVLSTARANNVVQYLATHGVDPSLLTAVTANSFGAANDAASRRVDFVVSFVLVKQ